MARTSPLAGCRVVSFAVLGPTLYLLPLLRDLGASITHVLPPGLDTAQDARKEVVRGWLLQECPDAVVISADLKDPAVRDAIRELAEHADLVVDGFRPGAMERAGLGHEALRATSTRLVYCSFSGYGADGPDRATPGHDLNYLARSGILALNASPNHAPAPFVPPIGDFATAPLTAALQILAAFVDRDRNGGTGAYIDVSIQESLFQAARRFVWPMLAGDGTSLSGSSWLSGAPWYRTYRTKDDRYVAVGAVERQYFLRLCTLLGHPEWIEVHFAPPSQWARIERELEAAFALKSWAEWSDLLAGTSTCATPVLTLEEATHDPQLRGRGCVAEHGGRTLLTSPITHQPVGDAAAPDLTAWLRKHGCSEPSVSILAERSQTITA